MALSRYRIERLMELGKLSISPYDPDNLTDYGYKIHIGTTIKVADIEDNYNTLIDTANPPEYITCDIPEDDGFVLDPLKTYYVTVKESFRSELYSIELVPNQLLVQLGLSIGMSCTSIPANEFGKTLTVTVTQPLKIYRNLLIGTARFDITDNESGSFPSGTILMYSGSEVPYGWLLCDGTNGTPDLRNRFVLGSDGSDVNTTGGSRSVTLSIDTIPKHKHSIITSDTSPSEDLGSDSGGGTVDVLKPFTDYIEATIDDLTLTFSNSSEDSSDVIKYRIPVYNPNESITDSVSNGFTLSGEIGETGLGESVSLPNPPYYKLMYIMKK